MSKQLKKFLLLISTPVAKDTLQSWVRELADIYRVFRMIENTSGTQIWVYVFIKVSMSL